MGKSAEQLTADARRRKKSRERQKRRRRDQRRREEREAARLAKIPPPDLKNPATYSKRYRRNLRALSQPDEWEQKCQRRREKYLRRKGEAS